MLYLFLVPIDLNNSVWERAPIYAMSVSTYGETAGPNHDNLKCLCLSRAELPTFAVGVAVVRRLS